MVPFRDRLAWLQEKLILAGTGGLLTSLGGSTGLNGSSTAAVQAAAFADLARNDAREISELFQRSIDREILAQQFPGQPALAWFTLANEESEDLDKYTQRIAGLSAAGFIADAGEVGETLGLTLTRQSAPAPGAGPFGFSNRIRNASKGDEVNQPFCWHHQNGRRKIRNASRGSDVSALLEKLDTTTDPGEYDSLLRQFRKSIPAIAEQVGAALDTELTEQMEEAALEAVRIENSDDYTRDDAGKFSSQPGGGGSGKDKKGKTPKKSPFGKPESITSEEAADYLAANPKSSEARAMSLWGEDEKPFSKMISGNSTRAVAWREKCAEVVNSIKPDTSGETVHRGWQFKSKDQQDFIMNQVLSPKGFENTRPGMSASYDSKISQRDKFIGGDNGLGVVWEIKRPSTARNFSKIFKAMKTSGHDESEAIFQQGSRFRIKRGTKPEVRTRADGRKYTHMQVEEITPKKR